MAQTLREFGKPTDRPRATALEQELRDVMAGDDTDLLRRKVVEVATFRFGVWRMNDEWSYLVAFFQWLLPRATLGEPADIGEHAEQGQQAISNRNVAGLEAACRQLSRFIPEEAKRHGAFASD